MLEVFAFETLTGQRLTPLPVSSASWSAKTNADESISCTVDGMSVEAQRLRVWEATTPGRIALAAVVDGRPMVAGPIWKRGLSDDGQISLTAGGLRTWLARRTVLPLAARTTALIDANGDPVTSLDTVYVAADRLSLGTIAKRYVELVRTWPAGDLPIVLPPDVLTAVGAGHERRVTAVDYKDARSLIDALSEVVGGPDIEFRAAWASVGVGLQWVMATGSPTQPRLGNPDPTLLRFPLSRTDLPTISEDATALASESWGAGGGQSDRVITARGYDSTLIDAGFPLLQTSSKGHNNVTVAATLQGYVDQDVALGKHPVSGWTLNVPARQRGVPIVGSDYWIGDLVTLSVPKGHPIFPSGADVVRRISAIEGDADDGRYSLTFAEVLG